MLLLLVVRSDLPASRGDVHGVKGLRLTAAEGPDQALKQMLICAGIEPDAMSRSWSYLEPEAAMCRLACSRRARWKLGRSTAFGQMPSAPRSRLLSRGAGKILIDVRRGDDPCGARHFTFAAMATTDQYLERDLESVKRAVRAIVKAQTMLRADPSMARQIGLGKFPPDAAKLITRTIERDVQEFYDPVVTEQAVSNMNAFAHAIGHLAGPVPYEQVVDVRLRQCWAQY